MMDNLISWIGLEVNLERWCTCCNASISREVVLGKGSSLACGEKSRFLLLVRTEARVVFCQESHVGGLVGLAGFLTARAAARIISAT